ncbi:MAG: class I SAM-dependent methyltransferase [Pseudomonadota bacterium]|nr:class I SAM-dependent methyltransferase [Pseudomonadota bacterium]
MTETLSDILRRRIEIHGPLRLDLFMGEALTGYYRTRQPLGREGDFVTAPEITSLFGEMLGLWCVDTWEKVGRPDRFLLVEPGPGRGTLMADILRTMDRVSPECRRACQIHLVEISPLLRSLQQKALEDKDNISWHETLETVPEGPAILVANEFFDALPVRQLCRTATGWSEVHVGYTAEQGFHLVTDPRPSVAVALVPENLRSAPEGTVVEISPASWSIMQDLARRLKRNRGAALVIDYGHDSPRSGATLQALRNHQKVSAPGSPGECDLTAHVDFAALSRVAREEGVRTVGPVGQGEFLEALGIGARAQQVAAKLSDTKKKQLEQSVERLVHPDAMGQLFRVLGVASPDLKGLAGFPGAGEKVL